MTFGELFAGIGGFSLGLERAGMTCKWQVEIDPYATAVLRKHWPDVPKHDDVRTFPPTHDDYSVDLICGGFPCQDISYAGKGAGLAGERSGLWHEFARVIGELRPRYVLVENVAALLTRGMGDVLGTLASLGYDSEWHVISASAVGAPHRRDRVWIISQRADSQGIRRSSDCRPGQDICRDGQASKTKGRRRVPLDAGGMGDGLSDANYQSESNVPFNDESWHCLQEPSGSVVSDSDRAGLQQQRRSKPIRAEQPAIERSGWWQSEPDVGRVAHGIPSRVDRLRCLGNAVVPQVVEVIGRAILDAEARMNA